MDIKQIIFNYLYPDVANELDNYKSTIAYYKKLILLNDKKSNEEILLLNNIILELQDNIVELEKEKDDFYAEILSLTKNLEETETKQISEIDKWLSANYKIIPNKVYQNKRKFKDIDIQVSLNQLITPESFEIQKFKKDVLNADNVYDYVFNITDKVSKYTTWTSDDTTCNTSDFYYYPEETLKLKKADCEDISNVIASCYPEQIGVGYGFYNSKGYSEQDKGFGHAFNVFIWNNELYIAEGTANRAMLHRYNPKDKSEKYHLLFVITKDFTYKCTDENIEFGYLVNW